MLNPQAPKSSLHVFIVTENDGKSINETRYWGMIGSLLYLTTSRSDTLPSFYKCARFQSTSRELHLTLAKHIIRNLNETISQGLLYLS